MRFSYALRSLAVALALTAGISAQQPPAVPRLIRFNGSLHSASRQSQNAVVGAAFSIYREQYDGTPLWTEIIAEEVAEVYPDLAARSADGRIETVKYQVLDSMLLNEVQRQNAQLAAQKEEIRSLQQRLARLESLLEQASTHLPVTHQ